MNPISPLIQQIIGSLVRAGMVALSAFFIQHNIITADQGAKAVPMLVSQVTAAIPALLALAWSFWQKHTARAKLMTSLMQGGITEDQVDNHIKMGLPKPTVFTPAATVPGIPANPKP